MLDRLEAEEARHANHRGAAVEQLLLLGEGADGVGHGVGGEHLEGRGDEERDGHEHGGARVGELLRATVSPVEISAPAAATKPSMARRPFMSSGPEAMKLEPSGPEKAKACCRVKDLGLAGTTGSSGVAAR